MSPAEKLLSVAIRGRRRETFNDPLNRRGGNHPVTTRRPGATEHGRKLGL